MIFFLIVLLGAGLLLTVAVVMVRVARADPRRPASASGVTAPPSEGAGYEPASLFGSGPWPMETPLDRRDTQPASRDQDDAAAVPERARSTASRHPDHIDRPEEDITVTETRRRRRNAKEHAKNQARRNHIPPTSDEATDTRPAADPLESGTQEVQGPQDSVEPQGQAEDEGGGLPVAATVEGPAPAGSAEDSGQLGTSGPSSGAAGSPKMETDPADIWAPSRPRRGLLRRRRTQDDLLSPVFRRRTDEPKLVVRLEKPPASEEASPSEGAPSAPPPAAEAVEPGKAAEAAPATEKSQTEPTLATKEPAAEETPAEEAPRIIHLVEAEEDEGQAQQQAPGWVQRVVETPQPEAVPVAPEPDETPPAEQVPGAAAAAEDEAGPLAEALSRASKRDDEHGLEGPKPSRSSATQAPPGALPDPLPFIRGIGRTRARVEAPPTPAPAVPTPLPPVLHIQTIYLDDHGDPVIVTKEEAAAAERLETAKREAARRQAEAAEREAVEREALLRAATDVEISVEALLDPEPPAASEPAAPAVPEEPAVLGTAQDVAASWEAEPPVDAPWTEVATTPPAEPQAATEGKTDKPPAPVATAAPPQTIPEMDTSPTDAPETGTSAADDARGAGMGPAATAPAEPLPPAEPPVPEPRRVSRPAAIGSRPDRKPTGPDPDRPRPKRPAARPGHQAPAGTPTAGVIPLSTGSAVRPHVTVNLTEEDIQDSDELYEVKALLQAITRDPLKNRKKRVPAQPSATRDNRAEQPAPDQREGRPGAEPGATPTPVRRRRPEVPEGTDRLAPRKPPAPQQPAAAQDRPGVTGSRPAPRPRPTVAQDRPGTTGRPAPRPAAAQDRPGTTGRPELRSAAAEDRIPSQQPGGMSRPAAAHDRPATGSGDRAAARPVRPVRPAGPAPSKPPVPASSPQPGSTIPPGAADPPRQLNLWGGEAVRREGRVESRSEPRPVPRPEPRPAARTEPRGDARPPSAAGTGANRVPRPDPRRATADTRPTEPAPPAKPPAGRRKAARPVTLILVDEEGRPQPD